MPRGVKTIKPRQLIYPCDNSATKCRAGSSAGAYTECIVLMQDEVVKATNRPVSVCVLASHETTYTIYQVWQLFRPPLHCLFQYVILRLTRVVGPLVETWIKETFSWDKSSNWHSK